MSLPQSLPQILGILNITSDSFSDGGRYLSPEAAVEKARGLMADGADILDVGPASSHPDAGHVAPEVEIRRLEAVMPQLQAMGARVSIDSFQIETQRFALQSGVAYLNDIHGFPEPAFYPELAASDAKLIVMFAIQAKGLATRAAGDASTIWERIIAFFEARIGALEAAGVARDRLILDPGMGFFLGAGAEPSLRVLADLPRLRAAFNLPVLISVSRKSFLRRMTGRSVEDIGLATLSAEVFAALQGVDFIRTHDARALRDSLKVLEALKEFMPRA